MSNTPKNQLTKKQARQTFIYRDGQLYWKHTGFNRKMDRPVGTDGNCRYRRVGMRLNGGKLKCYQVHNLIWNFFNGKIREGLEIDHIDRDGFNNDIDNLRIVTHQENMMNRSII